MHSLPLFVRLNGRPVILLGDGEPAAAKRRLLDRAGAQIAVVTGKPQDKGAVVVRHSCFFPAPIGFGSRTGLRAMQLRLPVGVAKAQDAI